MTRIQKLQKPRPALTRKVIRLARRPRPILDRRGRPPARGGDAGGLCNWPARRQQSPRPPGGKTPAAPGPGGCLTWQRWKHDNAALGS